MKRKQKELSENSVGLVYQRSRFMDLSRLFNAKLAMARASRGGGGGGGDNVTDTWGNGNNDRSRNSDSKNNNETIVDTSGANVWRA